MTYKKKNGIIGNIHGSTLICLFYGRGKIFILFYKICPKERNDQMKKQLSLFVAVIMLMTTLFSAVSVNADFSDVADDYRYKDAITTLSKLNIINGYDNGTFEPEKDITRAEFTKIIVYMLGFGDLTEPITGLMLISR